MTYENMSQAYKYCPACEPYYIPRAFKNQRATCITAIFSDDWNSSFNSKKMRSGRPRFANSGERMSGVTAVFSDDWKDKDGGNEPLSSRAYECFHPQRCDNLQRDKSNKIGAVEDYFITQKPSRLDSKQQYEEQYDSPTEVTPPLVRFPSLQPHQSMDFELEQWPETRKCPTLSRSEGECEDHCNSPRGVAPPLARFPSLQPHQNRDFESEQCPEPREATPPLVRFPSLQPHQNINLESEQWPATPRCPTPSLSNPVRTIVINICTLANREVPGIIRGRIMEL